MLTLATCEHTTNGQALATALRFQSTEINGAPCMVKTCKMVSLDLGTHPKRHISTSIKRGAKNFLHRTMSTDTKRGTNGVDQIRLVRCPFCGCLPKVRKEHCHYMRDDYYVVSCESVRCVANPKTYPCNLKGESRKARRQAVSAWNDSLSSNAED